MPRLKTKYLSREEKEDQVITKMQLFVESLEKGYNLRIVWNVDEIIFGRKWKLSMNILLIIKA